MRAYGCPHCDWPGHRNPSRVRQHIEDEHPDEDAEIQGVPW